MRGNPHNWNPKPLALGNNTPKPVLKSLQAEYSKLDGMPRQTITKKVGPFMVEAHSNWVCVYVVGYKWKHPTTGETHPWYGVKRFLPIKSFQYGKGLFNKLNSVAACYNFIKGINNG